METHLSGSDTLTAVEAKSQAQTIAFAPIMFQAVRLLRELGILARIHKNRGLTKQELLADGELSEYAAEVLVNAGVTSQVLMLQDDKIVLTKTGYFILNDDLTRVNMDFVHDVCYLGMFHLEESIRNAKPEGLKVFGSWPTIYEGLAQLPAKVQESWLAFDHFYSDCAFPEVLPLVFKGAGPRSILDIGGNTGKWALACVRHNPDVKVTILDLPGQLKMMRAHTQGIPEAARIDGIPINLLEHSEPFPTGYDMVWMSQFLDCFGEDDIVNLLRRAAAAMSPTAKLCILEPFSDCQKFQAAAHSLVMTSLYFTCMANGNSRMYRRNDMVACLEKAGLEVVEQHDQVGVSHSLLVCKRQML